MSQMNSKVRRNWRGAVLALATVGALGAGSAQAAMITFDLRLSDGTKSLGNVAVGQVVSLDLYALLNNANASKADDGILLLQGSLLSSGPAGGKVRGNLSGDDAPYAIDGKPTSRINNVAPFNAANTAYAGSLSDLNGDGDMDLGRTDTTTPAVTPLPWFVASPGSSAVFGTGATAAGTATDFKIGTFTYTVTAAPNGGTVSLNFSPRVRTDGTASAKQVEKFTVDGSTFALNGSDANIAVGSAVTLTAVSAAGGTASVGPTATNAATSPAVINIAGSGGKYVSPVVDITDVNKGSIQLNFSDNPGVIYSMLQLVGGDTAGAISRFAPPAGTTIVDSSDPNFGLLHSNYDGKFGGGGFNLLLKSTSPGTGGGFLNFDLSSEPGVTVSQIAAVPEPASLSLLGLGAFGLLARKRRK